MKTIKLIGAWAVSMLALTLCLQAGSIQTTPPYVNTGDTPPLHVIPVGSGANSASSGSTNIIFTVTSSDSTVHVAFGTCTNASTPPSFTTSSPYTATLNYPASQQGQSNVANVVITTEDGNGNPCTSMLWPQRSVSRSPLANFCFGGNYLASLIDNIRDFIPTLSSLRYSLTGVANSSVTSSETIKFKIFILKPGASTVKE